MEKQIYLCGAIDAEDAADQDNIAYDTFWGYVDEQSKLPAPKEEDRENPAKWGEIESLWITFMDKVQNEGSFWFDALQDIASLGTSAGLRDRDGGYLEGEIDVKAFYDEHKYLVLNGEENLIVLAEDEDEAEAIYDKVNATFL